MTKLRLLRTLTASFFCAGIGALASGCFSNDAINTAALSSASGSGVATASAPTGPQAAQIVFSTNATTGSFLDPGAGTGSPLSGGVRIGEPVVQYFDASGNLLARSNWPAWISDARISYSGASNSKATDPNCARFTQAAGDLNGVCHYKSGGTDQACGGTNGYYRVSEYDCMKGATPASTGTGAADDGVFIRLTFDRTHLVSTENILAVLKFAGSVINPGNLGANAKPGATNCINGQNQFDPSLPGCADMVWQAYLKSSVSAANPSPFLMLLPGAPGVIDQTNERSGMTLVSRQMILPLSTLTSSAANPVLQISRITGRPAPDGTGAYVGIPDQLLFKQLCNPNGLTELDPANTPQCVGLILYSLTLFRI